MSTDYNYDDKGQFFPFFVLTVTGLFTVPITYSVLKRGKELENTAPRIQSDFRPAESELIDSQRRMQKRRELKLKRIVASVLGWLLMGWMVYLITQTTRETPKIWNPYEILNLPHSATEKEIKSHYRKLSIRLHPDKYRPDPAKNETAESVSNHWVEVTKAFKALTDEEVRNNFIQYGHPDGKQSFSIGIALPQFIITEGNGKYVLLLYGALLGVVLPYLVGTWWYGSQKMTKEKIFVTSAGRLFAEYKEEMPEGAVIGALSAGEEFEERLNDSKSETSASVEKIVLSEDASADSQLQLSVSDREALTKLEDEQRRMALGLLWAYLGRIDLGKSALNEQKYAAALVALDLNEAFATMAPTFGALQPLIATYHTSQRLVQAIPPGGSPLLQLPYFTPTIIKKIEGGTLRKNQNLQGFMSLPDQQRRKLVVGPGLLSGDQYKTAMKVASQMPLARVEKAFFKVVGERVVTASSLIQFVVKLRIIPPGTTNIPAVNPRDLEDIDPKEGDLDALHGRKKGEAAEDSIQPPLAHAPFFPNDRAPRWYAFLAENKSGRIAVPPFVFPTFGKPIFKEDGTPTFNVQTLKMQFQAPGQEAEYPFTLNLICDSYVGMDSELDVIMKVEAPSKAEQIAEEDEISEPEEDTIAGQMNALKGGNVSKKPRVKPAAHEDSSDDSDSEEEDSESDTDTDTDTDEE